jgi:REP element-mobilizing transposase RayT
MALFKNKYRIESTRLTGWNYGLPGLYFITICTKPRLDWFRNVINGKMELNSIGIFVRNEWIYTSKMRKNIILDEFVIMPDHIHGIIIILDNEITSIDAFFATVETHCNASLQWPFDIYKNKFGP